MDSGKNSKVEYNYKVDFLRQFEKSVYLLPSVDYDEKNEKEYYPEITSAVYKILKNEKIDIKLPNTELKSANFISFRSDLIYLPTIYFSLISILNNQHIISITLSLLANYISNIFFGKKEIKNIELSVIVENESGNIKIDYRGPVDGMSEIKKIISQSK